MVEASHLDVNSQSINLCLYFYKYPKRERVHFGWLKSSVQHLTVETFNDLKFRVKVLIRKKPLIVIIIKIPTVSDQALH